MAEIRRIDVGFQGGQVLAARVTDEVYEELVRALGEEPEGRWHKLKTQDSEVMLDLRQVVYLRLDTEEHTVGF